MNNLKLQYELFHFHESVKMHYEFLSLVDHVEILPIKKLSGCLLPLYDHPIIHLFIFYSKIFILCLPCGSYCIKYT